MHAIKHFVENKGVRGVRSLREASSILRVAWAFIAGPCPVAAERKRASASNESMVLFYEHGRFQFLFLQTYSLSLFHPE